MVISMIINIKKLTISVKDMDLHITQKHVIVNVILLVCRGEGNLDFETSSLQARLLCSCVVFVLVCFCCFALHLSRQINSVVVLSCSGLSTPACFSCPASTTLRRDRRIEAWQKIIIRSCHMRTFAASSCWRSAANLEPKEADLFSFVLSLESVTPMDRLATVIGPRIVCCIRSFFSVLTRRTPHAPPLRINHHR